MKLIDIVFSIIFFIFLPLWIIIAFFILIFNGDPLIYSHPRIGQKGKIFNCYKFRTMKNNIDKIISNDPKLYKEYVENDYKIPESFDPYSKIGKLLRKTSIDEIPQFINIIKGEMSLVGPRPIVQNELNNYADDEQKLFLSVKPGITGYWQVNGRNRIRYPERKNLELFYAQNQSFLLDIKIIFKTIKILFIKDDSIS